MAVRKIKRNDDALIVGDVVTPLDRMQLMTVEGLRSSPFGMVVDCCWFDGDDALHYGTRPAKSVDVFPRPSPERKIMSGAEVRLRSRGPVMSVDALRRRDGKKYAECVWSGANGLDRRRLFPVEGLVFTMFERFNNAHVAFD